MVLSFSMLPMRLFTVCIKRLTAISLLAVFLIGCSSGSSMKLGEEVSIETSSFSFTQPDFEYLDEYKLSPGDVLDVLFQIQTWQPELSYKVSLGDTIEIVFPGLPELNQVQKVLPDGSISMPYIGIIKVYSKTTEQITNELKEKYKSVLKSPELYVMVPEYLTQIRELKKDLHTATRGLSRLVTVRPDGFVTFPMVGDVFVASRSIPQIKALINQHYSTISTSLHADLFLEKHAGAKIYVMGEVAEPGAYNITKPISLIQAFALAKGYTQNAQLDEIHVIRRKGKKMIATRVSFDKTLNQVDKGSLFYLLPDDIVFIPATPLSDAAHIAQQIQDLLMFRGWHIGFSWQLHREPDEVTNDIIIEP